MANSLHKERNGLGRLFTLVLYVAPVFVLFLFIFFHSRAVGVSVKLVSFATNDTGNVMAKILIENKMKKTLEFSYGVQILADGIWSNTNGKPNEFISITEDNNLLKTNEQRIVNVSHPPLGYKWRVVATCRDFSPVPDQKGGWKEFPSSVIDQ